MEMSPSPQAPIKQWLAQTINIYRPTEKEGKRNQAKEPPRPRLWCPPVSHFLRQWSLSANQTKIKLLQASFKCWFWGLERFCERSLRLLSCYNARVLEQCEIGEEINKIYQWVTTKTWKYGEGYITKIYSKIYIMIKPSLSKNKKEQMRLIQLGNSEKGEGSWISVSFFKPNLLLNRSCFSYIKWSRKSKQGIPEACRKQEPTVLQPQTKEMFATQIPRAAFPPETSGALLSVGTFWREPGKCSQDAAAGTVYEL